MFEWITSPEAWIALFTLTALEIVLGIDNIIFISILVGRLPKHQQSSGRIIGLSLAMGTRILLLLSLSWMMKLTTPLFILMGNEISGRDLILLLGGLFLVAKTTQEIHGEMNTEEKAEGENKKAINFFAVLIQIALLDIVFSLDSVITAVGMASNVEIMIIAVILAVGIMMFASKFISNFVESNPALKILALAFLILIGFALIAEGFDFHIPKGYIYFSMAFAVIVEMININVRKRITRSSNDH